MQVRVLGPLDVVGDDGTNVSIGGPIPTRLMAMLVAADDDGLAVDDIIQELWIATEPPADPVASIRTYVARLRAAMGPDAIHTGAGRYRLDGDVAVDAKRFEELVERARRASGSPTVVDLWHQALELWRGHAYTDHSDLDSIRAEANRLEELRAEASEAWFDARLAAGEGRELVADVETAVEQFPLREGFRAQQMTVLARAGRQAEALRAYQDFRGDLTTVGLEPSSRLVELEGQIAVGEVPRSGARRTLRGYELGERLGEGAFAIVHAATQASVGRQVAIKQIRGQLADQPEFIRQFEAEAHLVARLEHPHIVPLYDYWREPGSAYLVMRHLDGGSLQGQLLDDVLPLVDLVPMVTQVAAALDTAHRGGVIHRDVKPANILLDTDGNAYLSDFGIAVEEQERLDPEAWLSHGSPAYAPPEQLRREPVGPPADVYALGVTTYEALTAQLPFPGETTMAGLLDRQLNDPVPLLRSTHPDMPGAVDTVIQRATAKTPADRYSTASDFARELAAAAGLAGDEVLIEAEDRNPYKGLRAFDEADASDFAGRDRLTTRLSAAVADSRAVLVVGPSGAGKSSVVRAGLLPALRRGQTGDSGRWLITTLIPGADPFADLEAALLRVATDPPADLAGELRSDPDGLSKAVRRLVDRDRELLLVVDQLEELFTLAPSSESDPFLDSLVAALTVEGSRLRMVATIRADFYDHPLRHPALAELVSDSTISVRPLAADELERAITEPARAVGADFEPGLVAAITADVADQPGALPLLQYALTELYDRRVEETMTRVSYEDLGGVGGAIARRAEELFGDCDVDQQETARQIFSRLVSLGEGTEDTRRRIRRSELGQGEAVTKVLDDYGQARLLAFDRDTATREPTVEVAHEALIREWPRLQRWLDVDRDGLRIHRHLTETSATWDEGGRPNAELYRGGRLEAAQEWSGEHATDLNQSEAAFLASSVDQRATEQEAEARSNRLLRRLLTGVAIVAVMALVAGAVAFQQRGKANANAAAAEGARADSDTSRLGWQAAFQVDDNRQVGLLLAVEAARRDPGPGGLSALQRVLSRQDRYLGILGSGNNYHGAEWLDDETIIGFRDDAIEVFDVSTGEIVQTSAAGVRAREYRQSDGQVTRWSLAAVGGDVLAYATADGTSLQIVEVPSLEPIAEVAMTDVDGLAVAPDGSAIAVATVAGDLHMLERSGQQRFTVAAHPGETWADQETPPDLPHLYEEQFRQTVPLAEFPTSLVFLGDGSELVTVRVFETRFWDTRSGEPSRPLVTVRNNYSSEAQEFASIAVRADLNADQTAIVNFSGSYFAVANLDGSIVGANQVDGANGGFGAPKAAQVVFRDDVTAWTLTDRGTLSLADMGTGETVGKAFETQTGRANDMRLSPDQQQFVVASETGLALVSATDNRLLASAVPRDGNDAAGISPDGSFLARTQRGSISNSVATPSDLYDLEEFKSIDLPAPAVVDGQPISYEPELIYTFIAHDGGGLMSSATGDTADRHLMTAWDGPGVPRISFFVPSRWEGSVMSRERDIWAYGDGYTNELVVVSLEDGSEQRFQVFEDSVPRALTFSADDARMAVTDKDGEFRMLSTTDWAPIETPLDDLEISFVKFSPEGRWLITVEQDNLVRLRDADTYDVVGQLPTTDNNYSPGAVRFRGDLVELSVGGPPQLWDPIAGEPIGDPWPSDPGLFGSFTGETVPVSITGIGDSFLLWNLETDSWLDIACRAAGRNLTLEEWEQFGPADEPYRATCPQWPSAG